MMLLDGGYTTEFGGDFLKTFFLRLTGHAVIHVGPLKILAVSSGFQILYRTADATSFKEFKPHLGMLFLVVGGLLENGCDLLITIFLGFGCPIGVLVACLALSCKSFLQVALGLGSF